MTTTAIILFLLTITLSFGGGLYEVLVIYPNWKHEVEPHTLRAKLASSGQDNAGKRFWPLVSPPQVLLSIINIIVAWQYNGPARSYWLAAAIIVFVTRVITFSYFIPLMLRVIMQPEKVERNKLKAVVKRWTALSPVRLLPELFAWVLIIITLMKI